MNTSQVRAIASIGLLSEFARTKAQLGWPALSISAGTNDGTTSSLARGEALSWLLLEYLVVCDEVVYDAHAFGKLSDGQREQLELQQLEPLGLRPRQWPEEIYEETATKLKKFKRSLGELNLQASACQVRGDTSKPYHTNVNDAFSDYDEESYHDSLYASTLSRFSFADTNETFERAFFYAELANTLDYIMLPKPSRHFVDTLSRVYKQCAHERFKGRLSQLDNLLRSDEARAALPPVADYIYRVSRRIKRSPLDVALEVRESKNAAAYRRHLARLQTTLKASPSPAEIHALFRDIDKTVQSWMEDPLMGAAVRYKPRVIRVQILPAIAAVLTFLATGDAASTAIATTVVGTVQSDLSLVERDPILWGGQRYMAFVADWYQA